MELSLITYNFLAEKNNWTKVSNLEELDIGCKEHYIRKFSSMINVSDHSLRSNLYIWGINEDLTCILGMIKEINGEVIEYYTKPPKNFNVSTEGMVEWVSRDLSTDEILEYYIYDAAVMEEIKYSIKGELLQTNYAITKFDELPKEFQNALTNYPDKDKIILYADKPYGRVVEVCYVLDEVTKFLKGDDDE
jgi:hypothetical protein